MDTKPDLSDVEEGRKVEHPIELIVGLNRKRSTDGDLLDGVPFFFFDVFFEFFVGGCELIFGLVTNIGHTRINYNRINE